MKYRLLAVVFVMVFVVAGMSYATEDSTSLGAQAGEAVRELKGTADESYSTGMVKVGEASRKMEADARDAFKTLQEQWNVFAQQLRVKSQQLQKQMDQQWQDFQKSLNQRKS